MSESTSRRKWRIPNPISNVREVIAIVRELSLDDLQDAALRTPRIAVIGPSVDAARSSAVEIFGSEASDVIVAQSERESWPEGADVVLIDRRARSKRGSVNAPVIEFSDDEPVDRVRQSLVRVGHDLELALGRRFPELRQPAAMHVVYTTSSANARFALASSLPALVPVVGGILAIGADTIVLTKNQLVMIYKLAAIHDRDLDDRFQIYREMVPVVGAGLFWRTVARDLAALLPFAAGAVPKVTIAYAGTYAAGMAAHVYYLEGKRASAERMREFYREALRDLREKPILRSLPVVGRKEPEDGPDSAVIDVDYRTDTSTGMP